MSGTSLDGIDAVLVEFRGDRLTLKGAHYLPYGQGLKDTLLALHHPASNELHQAQLAGIELARLYAKTVAAVLESCKVAPSQVRAIGCHGQTIRHCPDQGYTLQIGNAALLAELSGIAVVGDFRSRDIAAGGEGAPLVPAFHDRMLRHPEIHRVVVNIGGISNLTDLAPGRPAHGFDCGPGGVLMDAWNFKYRNTAHDENGAWAASGKAIPELMAAMQEEPFLSRVPPKSSGRDLFNMAWLEAKLQGGEAPEDVQATLLALTARAIADAIGRFCAGAEEIYLCGGGAHNTALAALLEKSLPQCRIERTDALGISADWMEAVAFAWLARQAVHGQPASLPEVTGARHAAVLGAIYPA